MKSASKIVGLLLFLSNIQILHCHDFFSAQIQNKSDKVLLIKIAGKREAISLLPGSNLENPVVIPNDKYDRDIDLYYNHPQASNNRKSDFSIETADGTQRFFLLVNRKKALKEIQAEVSVFEQSLFRKDNDAELSLQTPIAYSNNEPKENYLIHLTFSNDKTGKIKLDKEKLKLQKLVE